MASDEPLSDDSNEEKDPPRQDSEGPTPWHMLFAAMLDMALTPVEVNVQAEVPMPKLPPKIDVILIRPKGFEWTEEQEARLCDGIRDVASGQVNIELKYTESVNELVLMKVMGSFAHTVTQRREGEPEVSAFVVSSKTPSSDIINTLYREVKPGVLRSDIYGYRHVAIISLNELPPEDHNLLFKMFASKNEQVALSFDKIRRPLVGWRNLALSQLVKGLFQLISEEGIMSHGITVENVQDLGRKYTETVIATASPEERLRGLPDDQVLQLYSAEKRLKGLAVEERLKGLAAEERLKGLATEERLKGLGTEERLRGLPAEKRLEGLSSPDLLLAITKGGLAGLSAEDRAKLKRLLDS